MKRIFYTSPSDQAMKAIDVPSRNSEYTNFEVAAIGEATRIVMEAALDSPKAPLDDWARRATHGLDAYPYLIRDVVAKKAQRAAHLLEAGALISDGALVALEIGNSFAPPYKVR